ncbi:ABC transporter permease [Rodentibacter haemolyticus]|uniref:Transport permease protein n=1 Tax=Rodentibacter haemolyticus TaxID=2778911 RepID=A0ABX6UYH1_9PAST|nr:ABC transporter permease [Rodentibacter haemolyticus]QPB43165.1 ABC transporter permease [Rodentibacter haemolyticus]
MKETKKYFSEFFQYQELLKQLVLKDIKLKYRRSYLGYIWSILNPLLMMTVLVIVFSNLFRFDIPNFAVYLLTGQLIFGFVSEATSMSVTSIIDNAPLLKKTYVPKYIFVISKVTSSLVNMLFAMFALVFVMFTTQVEITWNVVWIPIIFLEIYIFSLGLGFFLSAISVFFRDVQYLWSVFISIWMYLSPIIYPISIIPQDYIWWYKNLNPMVGYVQQFREVALNGNTLPTELLTQGCVIAILSLVIGFWIFNRKQNEFILYI